VLASGCPGMGAVHVCLCLQLTVYGHGAGRQDEKGDKEGSY
jgi:hypothetical protein